MSTRSRVIAPLAAALMIGFSMTAPAQAAVASSSNNGQSEQAPNTGGSAQAEQHRAGDAQQSARDDSSSDARSSNPRDDRGDRSTGAERSTTAKASAREDGERSGSARGDSSTNSGVQIDEPGDWQAQADPDGNENGGIDQPGGDGGVLNEDRYQDGNNGTGNDEDCEDDNRGKGVPGHCKDRGSDETPDVVGGVEGEKCPHGDMNGDAEGCVSETGECPHGDMNGEAEGCEAPAVGGGGTIVPPKAAGAKSQAEVLGVEKIAAPPAAGFVEDFAQPQVKGVELAAPAALPQTGAAEYLTLLTITGLGMATAGVLTLLFRRRLESGR